MRAKVGLGLRWEFVDELVAGLPEELDFLEIAPENYIGRGGYHRAGLLRLAQRYPLLAHGLTLSLGGTEPFDGAFLRELRTFLEEVRAPYHSDHLCFGASGGRVLHELLPIAFTRASLGRIVDRAREVMDALGMPLAVENISYYLPPGRAEIEEPDFLAELCERAGCGLLLDVNNAFVNATNLGFDVQRWLDRAPLERTVHIHVAGGEWMDAPGGERLLVDTHGADVPDPVYALLERALARTGPVPILLERDHAIPPLDGLLAEVRRVRAVADRVWTAAGGGIEGYAAGQVARWLGGQLEDEAGG
ncbi:DUF692 domain-containing protein [Pendulispora albinea]|uniref:DUF692 domain-containing protein n=1 Tax=Pendulispora albinea TaxID=2741071 RepID=A0ABZ2LW94_9BACT